MCGSNTTLLIHGRREIFLVDQSTSGRIDYYYTVLQKNFKIFFFFGIQARR